VNLVRYIGKMAAALAVEPPTGGFSFENYSRWILINIILLQRNVLNIQCDIKNYDT